MNSLLKAAIKRMIGQENWTKLSGRLKQAKCAAYYLNKADKRCELNEAWSMEVYSVPNSHTFFGYYDLSQLDMGENRLLAHVIPLNADSKTDCARIGYYTVGNPEFHEIAETGAWCWQQGARLRWHPQKENSIVFNNVYDGKFVSEIWNVENKALVDRICRPLYDVDADFSYGLSLNFARLQRLRPGYGYNSLTDETQDNHAPEDDGIFYVDLSRNTSKLIVSLRDLASEVDPRLQYAHYINHISISPDGKRFMFFHIWNVAAGTGWRTRLYTYEMETAKLNLLEEKDKVSHYDWRGNGEILVTGYREDKSQCYALYDVPTGEKTVIGEERLKNDGHPSFENNKNRFITDTYPLDHCRQYLYRYDMERNQKDTIASLYSSPLMTGERRCDLHPRLSRSERFISFDSTYSQNRRKIVLLRREAGK